MDRASKNCSATRQSKNFLVQRTDNNLYRILQQSLLERIQQILRVKYDVEMETLAVEQPPKIEFGELALPIAFELAKRLKKAPRAIAQELQAELQGLPGVAAVEIAGAGYLNIKLDRAAFAARMSQDEHADVGGAGFRLVEHTSINWNSCAWGICGMRSWATRSSGC